MILPFDSDETMGDLNVGGSAVGQVSAGRNLDIVGSMGTGTAGLASMISNVSLANNYIKPAFVRAGWSVTAGVDLTWNGTRYQFRIPVWVRSQHSDAEVRNNARAVLLGVRQGALNLQTFSDVDVQLQNQNASAGPNTGGQNTGGGANAPGWFDGISLPVGLDTALAPVTVALGVSAGTVLIGGGLIALILLRRR